jgi:hypothetical protein
MLRVARFHMTTVLPAPPEAARSVSPGLNARSSAPPALAATSCSRNTVTELGRQEVTRFAAHVTDWELERYRDLD